MLSDDIQHCCVLFTACVVRSSGTLQEYSLGIMKSIHINGIINTSNHANKRALVKMTEMAVCSPVLSITRRRVLVLI